MTKGHWILIALFVVFFIFLFKDQLFSKNRAFSFSEGIEREVNISVVRYNGKAISARIVVNGGGELENPHTINADDVGVDYYKHQNTVKKIESKTSQRFLPKSENGFSSEVVTKKIYVE
jgi:hypothetical protein